MSDEALTNEQVAEMRKKRTFRKFTFRGVDLDKLLDLSMEVGGREKRGGRGARGESHAAAAPFGLFLYRCIPCSCWGWWW